MSASSSPLSSPPSSDDEMLSSLSRTSTPARSLVDMSSPQPTSISPSKGKKREPSPDHETVLADNPDIAFIVMFRARFSEAFPPKLINFGPQDIERGVVDSVPSPQVENLMCALLGLVLNRKKPVERGHHGRALEDAVTSQKAQWPRAWGGTNPLSGSRNFNTMNPEERLTLLKSLALWSLHTSDAISNIIKDSYKQNRHDDDLNQPLSVQHWGKDAQKRRYWLIEGKDDTPFRLYRESNPAQKRNIWWSIAGSIDELRGIAEKLAGDGSQAGRRLSERITNALPRFEATEEKRKRREYRQSRKMQFARPEPGFSLYEGRTRGKRMRYTFTDDEDDFSLSDIGVGSRRSARNSGVATPAGPTVTASGRQVRPRFGNATGTASGENSTARGSSASDIGEGRPTRSGRHSGGGGDHIQGYNEVDEMDDEDEADEADMSSGEEWDGGDEVDVKMDDDDDDVSEGVSEEELDGPSSLIVTLQYRKPKTGQPTATAFRPSGSVVAHPKVEAAFISAPSIPVQPKLSSLVATQHRSPQVSSQVKLPPMNGSQIKWQPPAGSGSPEAHRPATTVQATLPSFSNFLYKPQPDANPVSISQPESTNGPSRPEEAKPPPSGPPQPFKV